MKINYLQISNVLSFKYYANVEDAPKINFENGLNILIGQNGAGKSTVLEVINFIFKKIIFIPYNLNENYLQRQAMTPDDRRNLIQPFRHNQNPAAFRLAANWDSADLPQSILMKITLDDIDKTNLAVLENNKSALQTSCELYSSSIVPDFAFSNDTFEIRVNLDYKNNSFSNVSVATDPGYLYLIYYDFYRQLIELHNLDQPQAGLPTLQESFTLIGGYRNYSSFSASVSLSSDAFGQKQNIRNTETSKSTNTNDNNEPPIFNLVRLRIAEKHQDLIFTNKNEEEVTRIVNKEPFLTAINRKLSLIDLKVEIRLVYRNSWSYSFNFYDTRRNNVLNDINSLSAGQKSIIHLIFESYGRGDLSGGVVIIDEPEIHLHYQFQNEYLQIVEKLQRELKCQYILVTHSEALISSSTIDKVKRFALDENNYTTVRAPVLNADQRTLVKILDNTRSTYAFFAKKVILVEGDSDRYFFKAVFQELQPSLSQEIAIIDIGGKGNYVKWKNFFEGFGLKVYFIGDFDNVFSLKEQVGQVMVPKADEEKVIEQLKQSNLDSLSQPQQEQLQRLHTALTADPDFLIKPKRALWKPLLDFYIKLSEINKSDIVAGVKALHPNLEQKIISAYANNIFLLKQGPIETYTGTIKKDLTAMIPFCANIKAWLDVQNHYTDEIKFFITEISR